LIDRDDWGWASNRFWRNSCVLDSGLGGSRTHHRSQRLGRAYHSKAGCIPSPLDVAARTMRCRNDEKAHARRRYLAEGRGKAQCRTKLPKKKGGEPTIEGLCEREGSPSAIQCIPRREGNQKAMMPPPKGSSAGDGLMFLRTGGGANDYMTSPQKDANAILAI
jgi:hypothetical protein